MKYNPPYGSPDPNAAFVDRNTPGAVSGSRVPAAAIEFPQREIMAVITAAGLSASNTDLTQLLQAINHLIAAATGGAGDPNYVLMTQARVRLPIFPEVQTSDGTIPIFSPGTGQVRVPPGYNFLHRGIYAVTTVQADFATAALKTYHLRWSPAGGFVLKDLADVGYNAGGLPEGNVAFDSSFDDMLVARVVTNASNAPTVTPLVNKDRYSLSGDVLILSTSRASGTPETDNTAIAVNLARRPKAATLYTLAIQDGVVSGAQRDEVDSGIVSLSRYSIGAFYRRDIVIGDGCRIGYTAWI